jgi:hypothetical protein
VTGFLTRRNVLIGAAATGAVAAGGVTWVVTTDVKSSVLAFFKRALPGVTIDEKSALVAINEFMADWQTTKRLVLGTAWNTAGVDTMAAIHPRFEPPARHMLTHFLLGSNFFLVKDPRAQPIVYAGNRLGTPCANPFANLGPPAQAE